MERYTLSVSFHVLDCTICAACVSCEGAVIWMILRSPWHILSKEILIVDCPLPVPKHLCGSVQHGSMKCERCGEDTHIQCYNVDGFTGYLCDDCVEEWKRVQSI